MKIIVKCPSCYGYGIYIGFAEMEGASVICSTCKGAGNVELEYVPFVRKIRDDVKTVALCNHGIGLTPGVDRGEVTYADFLAGKMPTDDADLYERITGHKKGKS